jgi:hypothetical protein
MKKLIGFMELKNTFKLDHGENFSVIVTNSFTKSASAFFGHHFYCPKKRYYALSLYRDKDFAILFWFDGLTHGHIGHEIFHATIRIMEGRGKECGNEHEGHALLCESLTKKTYRQLKKWGFEIK